VEAVYEPVDFTVARWVGCDDQKKMAEFEKSNIASLARDAEGRLSFLATSEWRLGYCMEQWPDVAFFKARDIN
jgi:peptide chain release factor 3